VEYAQIYKTVGLGTTIWSPLASGVLTGKYNEGFVEDTRLSILGMDWLKESALQRENIERAKALTTFAKELGLSLPVLSIAWCLKNPNVSTVILGASKTTQLTENFQALDAMEVLTPEVMEKMETILNNRPIPPEF
jgi:aryl-alcohol dehydrogenase-like predicted oxidoreductase